MSDDPNYKRAAKRGFWAGVAVGIFAVVFYVLGI